MTATKSDRSVDTIEADGTRYARICGKMNGADMGSLLENVGDASPSIVTSRSSYGTCCRIEMNVFLAEEDAKL